MTERNWERDCKAYRAELNKVLDELKREKERVAWLEERLGNISLQVQALRLGHSHLPPQMLMQNPPLFSPIQGWNYVRESQYQPIFGGFLGF